MNKEGSDRRALKMGNAKQKTRSGVNRAKSTASVDVQNVYNNIHHPFDFLQYFATKLTKLQGDNEATIALLHKCKDSAEKALDLNAKVEERDAEAFSLQQCLNEAQLSLYEERENFLRLLSESEKLKLERDDFRRKFQTALLLSGRDEKDVTHFLQRHPRAKELTDEMIDVKQQIRSCSGERIDEFESLDCGMLRKEIERLEKALRDTRVLHDHKLLSLKKALSLTKKESAGRVEQLELRLSATSDQLKEKTLLLHSSLVHNVELQKRIVMAEDEWMTERKRLTKPHVYCQAQTDLKGTSSGSSAVDGKHYHEDQTAIVKRLERNSVRLENEVLEKENVILELKMVILRLEKQLNRLREETDEAKKTYDGDRKALTDRNQILRRRVEQTEMRRKLDGAGFRADVAQIKKLLNLVERTLEKVFAREREMKALAAIPPPVHKVSSTTQTHRHQLKESQEVTKRSHEVATLMSSHPKVTSSHPKETTSSHPKEKAKGKENSEGGPRVWSHRAITKLLEATKEKVRVLDALIKKRMLETADEPN